MFENQPPNGDHPPMNLPTEPADIFESVEKPSTQPEVAPNALKSGLLKAKETMVLPNPEYSPPAESETIIVQSHKSPKSNRSLLVKIIIGIFGVFAVLVVSYGGWYLYQKLRTINQIRLTQPQPITVEKNNSENQVVLVPTSTGEVQNQTPEILFGDTDSDNDGLSDAEEKQYGTDSKKPDTDGDGLSDADEAKIWQTDPVKSDSDGDTYSDGSEIMNGYNPKGAGRFSPRLPIVRFVSSTSETASSSYTYVNFVIKTE